PIGRLVHIGGIILPEVKHPLSESLDQSMSVVGVLLPRYAKLEEGDVFATTSGTFEPCPCLEGIVPGDDVRYRQLSWTRVPPSGAILSNEARHQLMQLSLYDGATYN